MPKPICNNCKHCVIVEVPRFRCRPKTIIATLQKVRVCKNELCTTEEICSMFPNRHGMPLDMALQQCDRNGVLVHFEPKTPAAGAFVQITGPDYTTSDGTATKTLKAAA